MTSGEACGIDTRKLEKPRLTDLRSRCAGGRPAYSVSSDQRDRCDYVMGVNNVTSPGRAEFDMYCWRHLVRLAFD